MGNGCFCKNVNCINDINLDSFPKKPIINRQTENNITKDEEEIDKNGNKLSTVLKYFSESEKEIINNLKKTEKARKIVWNKKVSQNFDTLIKNNNPHYEIMLQRLLAQKKFKICGPKRRETIINGEKIKIMVNEILKENKDNIKMNQVTKKNSIVIKNNINRKGRNSISLIGNGIMANGFINNNKK